MRYGDLDELRAELAAVRVNMDPAYSPRFVRPPGLAGEDVDSAPTRLVSDPEDVLFLRWAPIPLGTTSGIDCSRNPHDDAGYGGCLLDASSIGDRLRRGSDPLGIDHESPVATVPAPTSPPASGATPPATNARDEASRPAAPRTEPQRSTAVAPPAADSPAQPGQPLPRQWTANGPSQEFPRMCRSRRRRRRRRRCPLPCLRRSRSLRKYHGRPDLDAVRDVLRQYQTAYRSLNVNGILQVFPSLGRDQAEQLRRTFASVTQYDMEIRNPQIDVQSDTATVRAEVARRMTPRVGNPVANEVQTEFRLRREEPPG